MPRYFIEVAYIGTNYSGFQTQKNANTIQAEIERALKIFYKHDFELTGSSRTDAGVHAKQNFFHFDTEILVEKKHIYNLNSLLNYDIVINNIFHVADDAHCRFDATSRTYIYSIHRTKDPFLYNTSYYYPFAVNTELLQQYAEAILEFNDFTSFSKRNTQVKHFLCNIQGSSWRFDDHVWQFIITADRFLRGMIKAVTGTMLRLAKTNATRDEFVNIINSKNCTLADFSPPSKGLCLTKVELKPSVFVTG